MKNYEKANDTLAHFGVPGMKWGRRKARTVVSSTRKVGKSVSEWGKEAGKLTKNDYLHPIITSKANRQSIKSDTVGNRIRRTTLYQNTKDLKDVNQRVDLMVAHKALKKAEKAKIKEIKTQYRKEYMTGESAVGKIYAKLTDADKIYADIMYNLNKRE